MKKYNSVEEYMVNNSPNGDNIFFPFSEITIKYNPSEKVFFVSDLMGERAGRGKTIQKAFDRFISKNAEEFEPSVKKGDCDE